MMPPAPAAVALFLAAAAGAGPTAPRLPGVVDLAGAAVEPLPAAGGPTTVFVFTRTDCPISNRYAPELRRMHQRFRAAGMRFWLVYPEGAEPVEAIRRHVRQFGYGFGALRDPEHALVRLTKARVTPEAAVFVASANGPRMVYRGRIDDRYVDFGRARARPRARDLEAILAALRAGKTVTPRTTTAVGCFIPPRE